MTGSLRIERLRPEHAAQIVQCFHRVYGNSYANVLFYKSEALAEAIADAAVCCVGALNDENQVLGHMAMTFGVAGGTPELGNTVVDPTARGAGVAWQVGAQLAAWCGELGYSGFLHYPTSNHHIMQRQSVKKGFETGLMLGYIPAETDGKVQTTDQRLRQAATIVYEPLNEPLADPQASTAYLPADWADLIRQLAGDCRLPRQWREGMSDVPSALSQAELVDYPERKLARLTVLAVGEDLDGRLQDFAMYGRPCLQVDFLMNDTAIAAGVALAASCDYRFCGWLPGYRRSDVIRLQKVDPALTDMNPKLVNPTAQALLKRIVD